MQKSLQLLIIGFVLPEPNSSAAGNRMMQLINLFKENNYKITFASAAQNIEFSENLENHSVDFVKIELNSETFDEFIIQLNPDVVVFDRFLTEEQFGWRVCENCPNALRILDTEDLHSLRYEREIAIKENRLFDVKVLLKSEFAKREIASIYRCDVSLLISEYEIDLLTNLFKIPIFLLYYLPILIENQENNLVAFKDRKDFVFIGNFLHEPNWDCVKYLHNSIWPLLNAKMHNVKMLIYGAYPSQKVLELHKPKSNFFIMGRAENAKEVITNARVVLAPIRFGAGIKGKLLEAMHYGTPSVTSSIGAEAMNGNLDWNGFINDNPEDFVKNAISLYNDEKLWLKSQENGYIIIEERFLKSKFDVNFFITINSILSKLEHHRAQNFIGTLFNFHSFKSTKYMSKWIEEKNKK